MASCVDGSVLQLARLIGGYETADALLGLMVKQASSRLAHAIDSATAELTVQRAWDSALWLRVCRRALGRGSTQQGAP
jgi:hypothetical protein